MKTFLIHGAVVVAISLASRFAIVSASAQVPDQLNHQGTVAVDGHPFTGNGRFKFAVVDAPGSRSLWSHDGSSRAGSEPATDISLPVTDGFYTVALGNPALPTMVPLSDDVFSQPDLHLRIWFSDGTQPFQHLMPDEALIPVAYARLAGRVAPGSVTAVELAAGSVTAEKLAPGVALSNLAAPANDTVQFSTSLTNRALLDMGFQPSGSLSIPGESWSQKVFVVPPARAGAHAYWSGSELIVLGGTTTDTATPPLVGFRYSPRTGEFAPLPTNNAPAFPSNSGSIDLSAWSSTWTGDALLVWNSVSRMGRRADPKGTGWTSLSNENSPSPRTGQTTVWTGREWVIWGGFRTATSLGDGARYDPSTDTWKPMSSIQAPPARDAARGVWTGSKMLIVGGNRNAPGSNTTQLGDVWSYDPEADIWERLSSSGITSSGSIYGMAWTGTRLLAFGLESSAGTTSFASGAEFDPTTGRWSALPQFEPLIGLRNATVVKAGHEIILWGGRRSKTAPESGAASENRGFVFDILSRLWREIGTTDAPVGRQTHSAVWTGSEMLVWGGSSGTLTPELADGGRYAPDRDRWVPIMAPPLRRLSPSVAWTGNELLVWGGTPTLSTRYGLKNGGRLRLDTGRWSPLPSRNAPEARTGQTAVWTGREFIIWGGFAADPDSFATRTSGALDTGARYDPVTDRWTPLPRDDGPSARANHSAVWTGREMIVWGGETTLNSLSPANTGARYDPVSNRWTPLPTSLRTGNLPGRSRHAAVWTGHEMIVWGGLSATYGLRYDPEGNSWSTLPTNGAPAGGTASSASSAVAFWTEAGMLAWGGRWAIYNPELDTWKPTSTAGSVAPSSGNLGVAAGSEVIFWSGSNGGPIRRYHALTDHWTLGSVSHAPAPRTGYSLVWTGDALLVVAGNETQSGRSLECSLPIFSTTRPVYLYARP